MRGPASMNVKKSICPGVGGFQVPGSCTEYMSCGVNRLPKIKSCEKGFNFHPKLKVCVRKENYPCENGMKCIKTFRSYSRYFYVCDSPY